MTSRELALALLELARAQGLSEIAGEFNIDVGDGAMATAKISVKVKDPGPSLVDDSVETFANEPIDVKPLANDIDPLGRPLKLVGATPPPEGGTVEILADGITVRYTPPTNFLGDVVLTYEAVPASS